MPWATFRSLAGYNYRLWAAGALVSNVGTWMQRTAQDWIVLAELTDHSASAVGIVMALQFGPSMLLLPFTGYAAIPVLLAGLGLLSNGVIMRRRTRSQE